MEKVNLRLLGIAKCYLDFLKSTPLEYEEDVEYRSYIEDVIKEATKE